MRLALRVYTTSSAYLIACCKGHKRVDLNGNAVEEVSEKDKARARELLKARKNKEKTRAEAQKAEAARDTAAGHAPYARAYIEPTIESSDDCKDPNARPGSRAENSATIRPG
jgi:sRNA-binding protein